MHYFDPQDLSKEEQVEYDAIENGEFVDVANFAEEKSKAEISAKATLSKARDINSSMSKHAMQYKNEDR